MNWEKKNPRVARLLLKVPNEPWLFRGGGSFWIFSILFQHQLVDLIIKLV